MDTEAMLAAAFGQEAVAAAGGAQPAAPAAPQPTAPATQSLIVDLPVEGAPATPAAPAAQVTAPAAQPAPVQPAAPAGVDVAARIAFLEQQVLANQQALLQAQQLAAQPAPAVAPATAPSAPPALTADELVAYKDSLPVIEKVAARVAADAANRVAQQMQSMQDIIDQQNRQLESLNGTVAVARNQALVASVQQRLQGVQLPEITSTPQWKAHLQTRAPFSGGLTVQQVMERAVQNNDPDTVVEFVQAYLAANPAQPRPTPAVVPGATAAPSAVGHAVPAVKKAISASALDAAMADAQAGKLSQQAYDDILAQAFAAAAGGLDLVQ